MRSTVSISSLKFITLVLTRISISIMIKAAFKIFIIVSLISCNQSLEKKQTTTTLEDDAKQVAELGCQIELLKNKTYDTEGNEKKKAEQELKAANEQGYALFSQMLEKYTNRKDEFQLAYKKAAKQCKYPLGELERETVLISEVGEQPSVTVSSIGLIETAFGSENKILYSFSKDKGTTFSIPEEIASLNDLMLGRGMGPQIAAAKEFTAIAAINGAGDIFFWKKTRDNGRWSEEIQVNKVAGVAGEGLMALVADTIGKQIIIVWLDTREKDKAKVYGAFSTDAGIKWTEKLIYELPDGSVCPCCKPNVLINGKNVYVMFRNNIKGSRDLHLVQSVDGGKTFSNAQKIGTGTWEIDGCPMDGGGMALSPSNKVVTAWKRKNEIYLSELNSTEQKTGEGWFPSISFIRNTPTVVWSSNGKILLKDQNSKKEIILGKGGFPKVVRASLNELFVIWESGNGVVGKTFTSIN